jgi:hypothetical protein
MHITRHATAAAFALSASIAGAAHAQCEYRIELIRYSDCAFSHTTALALGEGSHVGGYFDRCGAGDLIEGFIWTVDGGFEARPGPPGFDAKVEFVARDGSALGEIEISYDVTQVFWDADGTLVYLPEPPDPWQARSAASLSSDGRRILLNVSIPGQASTSFLIEDLIRATMIFVEGHEGLVDGEVNVHGVMTADGRTVDGGEQRAFVMTERGTSILSPPDGFDDDIAINALNDHGWFVGTVTDSDGRGAPIIGRTTNPTALTVIGPPPPGVTRFGGGDVDARGRVIVRGFGGDSGLVWVWDDGVYTDPREHIVDAPKGLTSISGVRQMNDRGEFLASGGFDDEPVHVLLIPVDTLGDVTADCRVDKDDLITLLSEWGECGIGSCPSDLTGDGEVGVGDLLEILEHWD